MKKILLTGDEYNSWILIKGLLQDIGYTEDMIIRCRSIADLNRIKDQEIDIILTDLTLQGYIFQENYEKVANVFPDTPIIVITDRYKIEMGITKMLPQTQDFIAKEDLEVSMLKRAIHYAIDRNQIMKKVLFEKQKIHAVINNTHDIIWCIDKNNKILLANNAYWQRISAITGKEINEIQCGYFDKNLFKTRAYYFDLAFKGQTYKVTEKEKINGCDIYEEMSFTPIRDEYDNIIGICCILRDITDPVTYIQRMEKENEQLKKKRSIKFSAHRKVSVDGTNI